MIKRLMIAAALLVGSALHAEEGPLQLKGKMGIGLDSMPGLTLQQASILGAPGEDARQPWSCATGSAKKFSLEAQLAASYSSQPSVHHRHGLDPAPSAWAWPPNGTSSARPRHPWPSCWWASPTPPLPRGRTATGPPRPSARQASMWARALNTSCPFLRSASVEGSLRLRVSSTESKSDKGSQAAPEQQRHRPERQRLQPPESLRPFLFLKPSAATSDETPFLTLAALLISPQIFAADFESSTVTIVARRRPKTALRGPASAARRAARWLAPRATCSEPWPALPGATTANDYLANLMVRGGGMEDNLILFDGFPVSYPFHFGGVESVFHPGLIASADFLPSGYDARYWRQPGRRA